MTKENEVLQEYIVVAEYDDGVEITLDVLAPSQEAAMSAFKSHMGQGYRIISIDAEVDYEEKDVDEDENAEREIETTSTDVRVEDCVQSIEAGFVEAVPEAMEELL